MHLPEKGSGWAKALRDGTKQLSTELVDGSPQSPHQRKCPRQRCERGHAPRPQRHRRQTRARYPTHQMKLLTVLTVCGRPKVRLGSNRKSHSAGRKRKREGGTSQPRAGPRARGLESRAGRSAAWRGRGSALSRRGPVPPRPTAAWPSHGALSAGGDAGLGSGGRRGPRGTPER